MKQNVGFADRFVRVFITALVGYLFFFDKLPEAWATGLFAAGVALLLTSLVGMCPLYYFLGIDTDGEDNQTWQG